MEFSCTYINNSDDSFFPIFLIPGESRQHSAESKGKNWAYLPKHRRSSSSTSSSGSSESILSQEEAEERRRKSKSPSPEERKKSAATARRKNSEGARAKEAMPASEEASRGKEGSEAGTGAATAGSSADSSYKKRALSAKSHVFRKGKIEAAT